MRLVSALKLLVVLIGALPVFWVIGRLASQLRSPLAVLGDGAAQWNEIALVLALFWCGTLLSALIVGFVIALAARAVGHAAIRRILTPSQAQWFGLLASALVWLSLTGFAWSNFSGMSDIVVAAWYVSLGVFVNLFNVVWLLLGIRAASAVNQLRAAGVFFGAAVGTFCSAIGLLTLLAVLLNGIDIQPTLPLFGLLYLLLVALWIVPPALAIVGGSALCSGLLAARASNAGPAAGND